MLLKIYLERAPRGPKWQPHDTYSIKCSRAICSRKEKKSLPFYLTLESLLRCVNDNAVHFHTISILVGYSAQTVLKEV